MATLKQKADKRIEIMEEIIKHFSGELGDDIDYCAKGDTNTQILNMPILIGEEELWAEIMVSIPKLDYDGYEKREDFQIKQKERKDKEEQKAKEKAKKIEKDKKIREKKAKEKGE